MLSAEDNELLTRTGPGTAMGALLRHYWIPVLQSGELPPGRPGQAGGAPRRAPHRASFARPAGPD